MAQILFVQITELIELGVELLISNKAITGGGGLMSNKAITGRGV